MKDSLILSEQVTQSQLEELYKDEHIRKACSQDNEPFIPIEHPLVKYYGTHLNNEFVGAFLNIQYTDQETEIHSLLKKEAIPYSRDFGKLMLSEVFKDEKIVRVSALVPENLESVDNYLEKLGFILEGTKRKACLKNGKYIDVKLFGILREEWSNKWVS